MKTKVRYTGMTAAVDENVGLWGAWVSAGGNGDSKTYSFQISVDNSLVMHINQSHSDVSELEEYRQEQVKMKP